MKLACSDHEITLDEWKMLVRYEVLLTYHPQNKEDWDWEPAISVCDEHGCSNSLPMIVFNNGLIEKK